MSKYSFKRGKLPGKITGLTNHKEKTITTSDDSKSAEVHEWTHASRPYEQIAKVKEIIALIDKPVNTISAKTAEFDKKELQKRKDHIKDLWNEIIKIPGADMTLFYDQSWENATTTDASIKSDISALNVKYESGLQVINSFDDVGEDELKKLLIFL